MTCDCFVDLTELVQKAEELVVNGTSKADFKAVARSEQRLRRLWSRELKRYAERSANQARSEYMVNGLASAKKKIDDVMAGFADSVKRQTEKEIELAYKNAKKATIERINGKAKKLQYGSPQEILKSEIEYSFTLRDIETVEDLKKDQFFWIKEHYDNNTRQVVRDALQPEVFDGMSRVEAGKKLEGVVNEKLAQVMNDLGYVGSTKTYFERLAANVITNSRTRGQINAMRDAEFDEYELVNPLDKRTSKVCKHLNGKKFRVERAAKQIEEESGVTEKEQLKALHPWLSFSELASISPGAGQISRTDSDRLAAAGVLIPPFHFGCRTTLDPVL